MLRLISKLRARRISALVVAAVAAVAVPILIALNPLGSSLASKSAAPELSVVNPLLGRMAGKPKPSRAHEAAVSALSLQQAAPRLAVFRRASTPADVLPSKLLDLLGSAQVVADGSLARRALVTASGTSVYLVPGETGICLVSSTQTEAGCSSPGAADSSGANAGVSCSPFLPNNETVEIAGIVPDEASNPTLVMSDGTTRTLHVEGNAYLEQFPRHGALPIKLRWTTPGGVVESDTALPPDAATESCVTSIAEIRALQASGKIPHFPGPPPPRSEAEANGK
jgi:hypothetical protein